MIMLPNLHGIAAVALERMLYCLAEGSAVAAIVALVLRLTPERNSRTRFAVWLATLAAVVALPLVQMAIEVVKRTGGTLSVPGIQASSHALFTLSSSVAEYIVLAWAVVAGLGLLRVGASLLQIRRLRRDSVPINPQLLGAEVRALILQVTRRRPVSIRVSSTVEVPTAIGFFRPAVLVPVWLAESADAEELKYVLLHEIAHLERWDDWTNLAEKLAKAMLFFHPGVWWIERKLSLDREMACDDAVLAQTGAPRLYARCLAHVAEKSFLRRQIILAQAAVDRMRQLSLRVARILSADRPRSTRLWKPAVPMVTVIALLCVVSTSSAPNLISVNDNQPQKIRASLGPNRAVSNRQVDTGVNPGTEATAQTGGTARASLIHMASFNPDRTQRSKAVPARLVRKSSRKHAAMLKARATPSQNPDSPSKVPALFADKQPASLPEGDTEVARAAPEREADAAVERYGVVFVVMTGQQITSAGSITWQVNMWELRLPAPVECPTKPIPRKI